LSFVYERIKQDKLIAFSKSSEFPDHAKQDRAVIDNMGIKSLLVLPIKIDNVVQFGFSLSTVTKHLKWEKQTINRIMIAANILALVMQRKVTLKQIVEEKEWAEAVLEGMPQVAYVQDLQGRMKRWNKNLEDLFEYSTEELRDKFMGDFLNDEDLEQVTDEIQKLIADGIGTERSVEYDIVTKSGKILPSYYGSGKLLEIGGETFLVGQTIDMSEMKLLKDQLEAENVYLRQEQ
jgi:PAS domain S-box-containing protein